MFDKLGQNFKKRKEIWIILIVIMAVGIFLRTYKFHDLLRFGTDQARDAAVIREIIQKGEPLPLLGPKAGGTTFKMGPMFYYFQYIFGKIFGIAPDKLAYPDLFLSILTIPFFFLFLRIYFEENISLALTALFALSFFAVQYSRFAWNPNSLLLFSILFLYSFLKLIDPQTKRKLFWAAVTGLAIGIGVQLHTFYILIVFLTLFISSVYFVRKKALTLKHLGIIFGIVIFLNIPQIISEVKTNFQNAKNFYSGITVKSDETVDDPEIDQSNKLLYSTAWHIQANYLFIAPLGDDTDSDFLKVINKIKDNKGGVSGIKKNIPFFLGIFLGSIFSVAGYFLLIQAVKQETDERKKTFLMLILLQIVLAFFILWPLAHLLVLRYFLMFQFLPFLFLGLIIKAFNEKFTQKAYLPALTIIFLLCTFNIYRIGREFHDSANDRGRLRFALWGEEEAMGNFILSHTEPGQRVHMVYEPLSANKYIRPLSYFAKGIDFPKKPNTGEPTEKDAAYFSMILNTKQEKNIQERRLKKQNFYNIVDSIEFGRLKIYKLELKK